MPGLTIVDLCDATDFAQAVPQVAAREDPTYLRLLRGKLPIVLDECDYTFQLGWTGRWSARPARSCCP
ncbi:hypothetical protein B7755_017420, partial [Streptomyces sp. NBS 14/10]